ncbi:predicted protein [Histoplasma capsulatum H143]|uniref:Uncharacterized protein n=1 Tax=Ajellomyces capsulatus (strain H143) TaxID=544712 RepID=C6HFL7_AJECH|nr:predicted protein [Histoplasma capsulatum H143]
MSKFPQAPFAFVDPKIFVASDLNCEFTVAWSSSGYVISIKSSLQLRDIPCDYNTVCITRETFPLLTHSRVTISRYY